MNILFKIIDKVNDSFGNCISYLNIVVVSIVCWEIIARYVFDAPTVWASESMVLLSGGMYVLAGGYAQLHKRHVKIDLVYSHLGPKKKAICDMVSYIFFCVFMYALVIGGSTYAWESISLRETTGTPWDPFIFPVKMAIPIGGALIWFQMTADLIRNVRSAFMRREV